MSTHRPARPRVLGTFLGSSVVGLLVLLLLLVSGSWADRDGARPAAALASSQRSLSTAVGRVSAAQAPAPPLISRPLLSASNLRVVLVISHPRLPVPDLRGVPGALPPGLVRSYNDAWRGWPVTPLHIQHPVRGDFNEPRGQFHFGVDISVDDAHPERGAPPGRTHRVYAVESGLMQYVDGLRAKPCQNRHFKIGHFAYWHVDPTLPDWTPVRAGQMIGWSCRGWWHIHLGERQSGLYINPLLPGSKLAPYTDPLPPRIGWLAFFGPEPTRSAPATAVDLAAPDGAAPLSPQALHGLVDARLEAGDPQLWSVLPPIFRNEHQPFALAVRIASDRPGAPAVLERVVFVNEALMDAVVPLVAHFAPGTSPHRPAMPCATLRTLAACRQRYVYRLFASAGGSYLLDTTSIADGRYLMTVTIWNDSGRATRATTVIRVANHHLPALRAGLRLQLSDAWGF